MHDPSMTRGLRKIGGNALSLLTSEVRNRATSFVLYSPSDCAWARMNLANSPSESQS
jgi:hypothetical protein